MTPDPGGDAGEHGSDRRTARRAESEATTRRDRGSTHLREGKADVTTAPSEPAPSLKTRRRPRWSRRRTPAITGRNATGSTSRAHIAPLPTRLGGKRGDARESGGEKAEEVERRAIGREDMPMSFQTRSDVGVEPRENIREDDGAESTAR